MRLIGMPSFPSRNGRKSDTPTTGEMRGVLKVGMKPNHHFFCISTGESSRRGTVSLLPLLPFPDLFHFSYQIIIIRLNSVSGIVIHCNNFLFEFR